ncbi:hypothetical protein K474DRAFT_1655042 [Panus rudis PR-1116 ss-1]|nr:hypothetical protein K474DRAFT_1655042 [Panus rudis PR-1116 ss-1]
MTRKRIPLPQPPPIVGDKAKSILRQLPQQGIPIPCSEKHADLIREYKDEIKSLLHSSVSKQDKATVEEAYERAKIFKLKTDGLLRADSEDPASELEENEESSPDAVEQPVASKRKTRSTMSSKGPSKKPVNAKESPKRNDGRVPPCINCAKRGSPCNTSKGDHAGRCDECIRRKIGCSLRKDSTLGSGSDAAETISSDSSEERRAPTTKKVKFSNPEITSSSISSTSRRPIARSSNIKPGSIGSSLTTKNAKPPSSRVEVSLPGIPAAPRHNATQNANPSSTLARDIAPSGKGVSAADDSNVSLRSSREQFFKVLESHREALGNLYGNIYVAAKLWEAHEDLCLEH